MIEEKQDMTFENITSSIIAKNRLSHAYLIEVKSESDIGQVVEFAKKIITNHLSDKDVIEKSNQLVENKANLDFKYIENDGQWIKKEQILNIQRELSTKSLENNKRVYIIDSAEKLNKSSANTLLKFLEEPNPNIVGILLTRNKYQVLETIISRCQFLKASQKQKENSNTKEYDDSIIAFVDLIEQKNEKSIAYLNKLDSKLLTDRNALIEFLSNILLLYNDMLYVNMEVEPNYFSEYKEKLTNWSEHNNSYTMNKKITAINNTIENLKYNTNIKLMLDKLIILMSGCDVDV